MSPRPDRVFLVPSGYNFRAVLAFCRALRAARAVPAIIACTDDDPIFRTRFSDCVVFTRKSRTLDLADFAAAVIATRRHAGAVRCVLAPTSEFFVRWALRNRSALEAVGCYLPLPDEAAYLRVTDKAAFTAFCRAGGLPVPTEISDPGIGSLPCVAKPRWNVAPDGRSLYPYLLRTPDDWARFTAQTRREDFFFQEWIEGRSLYLFFHLPMRGAATVYSQENFLQQPEGKSILFARAATLHESPAAHRWEDALRATGFYGVVMLELRRRGDELVLIEANPRLWGPLQLCVDGCPALLLNYIAEHTGARLPVAVPRPVRRVPPYLWLGGWRSGVSPTWHGATPRFPVLHLLRHLRADVYFRADSWRQFFHERRTSHNPPAPVASCAEVALRF